MMGLFMWLNFQKEREGAHCEAESGKLELCNSPQQRIAGRDDKRFPSENCVNQLQIHSHVDPWTIPLARIQRYQRLGLPKKGQSFWIMLTYRAEGVKGKYRVGPLSNVAESFPLKTWDERQKPLVYPSDLYHISNSQAQY